MKYEYHREMYLTNCSEWFRWLTHFFPAKKKNIKSTAIDKHVIIPSILVHKVRLFNMKFVYIFDK